MESGIYLRDINAYEMLEQDIKGENILSLICNFKSRRVGCNYSLHYNNWDAEEFSPFLTIADGDKVLFFNRFFVHRKIEEFVKKKKEPKTNKIVFEQPLDIKELGGLVEKCGESFNIVRARLFLDNLPKEHTLPKDKIKHNVPSQAFYSNYSISFLDSCL